MGVLSRAFQGFGEGLKQVGIMQLQEQMQQKRDDRLASIAEKSALRKQEFTAGQNKLAIDARTSDTEMGIASREGIAASGQANQMQMNTDRIAGQRAVAGGKTVKPVMFEQPGLAGEPPTKLRTMPDSSVQRYDPSVGQWVPADAQGPISDEQMLAFGEEASTMVNDITELLSWDSTNLKKLPGGEKAAIRMVTSKLTSGASSGEVESALNAAAQSGNWSYFSGGEAPGPAAPAGGSDTLNADVLSVMRGGTPGGGATAPAASPEASPAAPPRFPPADQLRSPAQRESERQSAAAGAAETGEAEVEAGADARIDQRSRIIKTFGLSLSATDRKIGRVINQAVKSETAIAEALSRSEPPKYEDLTRAIKFAEYRQDSEKVAYYTDLLKGL